MRCSIIIRLFLVCNICPCGIIINLSCGCIRIICLCLVCRFSCFIYYCLFIDCICLENGLPFYGLSVLFVNVICVHTIVKVWLSSWITFAMSLAACILLLKVSNIRREIFLQLVAWVKPFPFHVVQMDFHGSVSSWSVFMNSDSMSSESCLRNVLRCLFENVIGIVSIVCCHLSFQSACDLVS